MVCFQNLDIIVGFHMYSDDSVVRGNHCRKFNFSDLGELLEGQNCFWLTTGLVDFDSDTFLWSPHCACSSQIRQYFPHFFLVPLNVDFGELTLWALTSGIMSGFFTSQGDGLGSMFYYSSESFWQNILWLNLDLWHEVSIRLSGALLLDWILRGFYPSIPTTAVPFHPCACFSTSNTNSGHELCVLWDKTFFGKKLWFLATCLAVSGLFLVPTLRSQHCVRQKTYCKYIIRFC